MITYCEKCKKKINTLWDPLLELVDNKYLCYECGEPIDKLISNLSHIPPRTYTKENFDNDAKKILDISEQIFAPSVIMQVNKTIKSIGEKTVFIGDNIPNCKTEDSISTSEQHTNISLSAPNNKIGEKIIATTQIITWINIILIIIIGIICFFVNPIIAVLILTFGILFTWIFSLFLQGYGQLIKNSDEIVRLLYNKK